MLDAQGRQVGRSTGEGQVLKFAFITTVVALVWSKDAGEDRFPSRTDGSTAGIGCTIPGLGPRVPKAPWQRILPANRHNLFFCFHLQHGEMRL